jgi:hypothetical protein
MTSVEQELSQQEMNDYPKAYRGMLGAVMIAQNMLNHIDKFVGAMKCELSNSDQ